MFPWLPSEQDQGLSPAGDPFSTRHVLVSFFASALDVFGVLLGLVRADRYLGMCAPLAAWSDATERPDSGYERASRYAAPRQ
jgi:hypothetical protein